MTTTMITRPEHGAPQGDGDMFARVLTAINSHRACPRRRSRSAEPDATLGAHLLAVVRAQDAAIPSGRRAPRTVAEMRARLAALTEEESDACGVCGFWQCRCGQARARTHTLTVPAPVRASGGGQCSVCGGWFDDWPGGVCDACR
ncbi:hypothetical protein [Streptomyces sp. NPDC006309]|uniref:hypothetical protein n=1 Tax=Streptomyces sp. NPDC006309 TaxID=3156749 RepID=UPI0033A953CA